VKDATPTRAPASSTPRASRPPPTSPPTARATTRARRSPAASAASPADTLGLLLAVLVTAAGVSDSAAGLPLLTQVAADNPAITKAWADSAYRTKVIEGAAALGINVEIVQRDPATKGFIVLPRRWVAERTFGRLMLHRRLVRDYETLPARSEAMINLMTRRLTRESTPTWRST
jgi:transposase